MRPTPQPVVRGGSGTYPLRPAQSREARGSTAGGEPPSAGAAVATSDERGRAHRPLHVPSGDRPPIGRSERSWRGRTVRTLGERHAAPAIPGRTHPRYRVSHAGAVRRTPANAERRPIEGTAAQATSAWSRRHAARGHRTRHGRCPCVWLVRRWERRHPHGVGRPKRSGGHERTRRRDDHHHFGCSRDA